MSKKLAASDFRVSIARLARRLRNERDPSNDLSVTALGVLGVLMREGECTLGDLAAHERVQPPSMTRTVRKLEDAGLVNRRQCPEDGRSTYVTLSASGRATLLADRRRRDAWLARAFEELTPAERQVLGEASAIMDKLVQTP
ncbi:MAG TPA: MarR family transcriptional regulator [Marmoricola sp.]|nr:MarR family transcriptional regulator [Marmoricola sp.]